MQDITHNADAAGGVQTAFGEVLDGIHRLLSDIEESFASAGGKWTGPAMEAAGRAHISFNEKLANAKTDCQELSDGFDEESHAKVGTEIESEEEFAKYTSL